MLTYPCLRPRPAGRRPLPPITAMYRFAMIWAALLIAGAVAPARGAIAPGQDQPVAGIATGFAIMHLAEPLVATGPTGAAENAALAQAVAAYERRRDLDDFSSLTGFLSAYPRSAWRVAVLTNLGISYLHYGYFSRAIEAWEAAWREGKHASDRRARALVDRAAGELALPACRARPCRPAGGAAGGYRRPAGKRLRH